MSSDITANIITWSAKNKWKRFVDFEAGCNYWTVWTLKNRCIAERQNTRDVENILVSWDKQDSQSKEGYNTEELTQVLFIIDLKICFLSTREAVNCNHRCVKEDLAVSPPFRRAEWFDGQLQYPVGHRPPGVPPVRPGHTQHHHAPQHDDHSHGEQHESGAPAHVHHHHRRHHRRRGWVPHQLQPLLTSSPSAAAPPGEHAGLPSPPPQPPPEGLYQQHQAVPLRCSTYKICPRTPQCRHPHSLRPKVTWKVTPTWTTTIITYTTAGCKNIIMTHTHYTQPDIPRRMNL